MDKCEVYVVVARNDHGDREFLGLFFDYNEAASNANASKAVYGVCEILTFGRTSV